MKSSFEIAMEKLGGSPLKKLSEETKKQIAQIESIYKAKIAEIRLKSEDDIKKAASIEEIDIIKNKAKEKIAELEAKCEKEKEKTRSSQ